MSLIDSIQLEVWKGDWDLPSVDVDCLKILTYAKFTNAPINVKATNNPFLTPEGHLPVLKLNNDKFCTVDKIIDLLCEHNNTSKQVTSSLQNIDTIAFNSLIEERLYPALQYLWWIDQRNLYETIKPWYSKALPFPLNFYYPGKYQKKAKLLFETLYPTEEIEDVKNLVYSKAKECISDLSAKLGESDYFLGSIPTKLDALVFSYLAPILKIPLPNSVLQDHLKEFKNLVRFITRILDSYFETEQEIQKLKKKQENVKWGLDTGLETKTIHQIYAGIFATVAMLGYAFSTGIMRIQNDDDESDNEPHVYDDYNGDDVEYDDYVDYDE